MQLGTAQDVLCSLTRQGLLSARGLYAQLGEHKKVALGVVVVISTFCLVQRVRRPKKRVVKDRRYPLKDELPGPPSHNLSPSPDPGPPAEEEQIEDEVELGEDAAYGIVETPETSSRIDNNRVFHDLLQLYGREAGVVKRKGGTARRHNLECLSDTEALEVDKERPHPPPPAELKDGRVIPGPAPQGLISADRRYYRQPSTRRRRRTRRKTEDSEEAELSEPLSEDEVSDSTFSYTSTVSAPVFSQHQRREPRRRRPDLLAIPNLPPVPPSGHSANSLQALAKTLASASSFTPASIAVSSSASHSSCPQSISSLSEKSNLESKE